MSVKVARVSRGAVLCLSWLLCACVTVPTDLSYFQPKTTTDESVPERPLDLFDLYRNVEMVGLTSFQRLVPTYKGDGKLFASWNVHPDGKRNRPTFVVMHGGHGLVPQNFANALWLQSALSANVLILDSFWSRGIQENWRTWTRYGANMRVLDAIAAGRWLVDTQGVDAKQVFLFGDSQGGWTALRAFTSSNDLSSEVTKLYRGGVALYPVCRARGTPLFPELSPYAAPLLIFTGGKDTGTPISECDVKIFKAAERWIHYPNQTHAWDVANRGAHSPAVEECSRAMNVLNRFPVCRNNKATSDMYAKIKQFVSGLL